MAPLDGPIRGIIFDCDGLLVDTEVPALQAWQEIYREHGCDLALETWAACLGGSGAEFDACAHLEEQIGQSLDREALQARRLARKRELVASQPLLPGVAEYLASARELGLKIGLASSSERDWVIEQVDRLDIRHAFDCIVTADDVERVKPDPEIYRLALSKLGLQANEAIVLEDSPNGITAAQAAGLFCVAVPNALTAQLPIGHADLRVESLGDLPLSDLLALLAARVG